MEHILNRAKFNRTADLSLLPKLGLTKTGMQAVNNYLSKGELPDNILEGCTYSKEIETEAPFLFNVLNNPKMVQVVRIVSYALKKANLHYVQDGKVIELNQFFTAMYGVDEVTLLNMIVDNKDLLEFISTFKLTIRQSNTTFPYVGSISNVRTSSESIGGTGIVFTPKIEDLDNDYKTWIKVAAFMDACSSLTLGPETFRDELVTLLDGNAECNFLSDKLYLQLVLLSLKRGISIQDMYTDMSVPVIDYESIYNTLGRVVLINKKGEYEFQDDMGSIVKVKGDKVLSYLQIY